MTTITRAPATRAPALTLDEKLALTSLEMDGLLDGAAVEFEVNTAHIELDPLPEITIPQTPQTAIPCPYRTPIAALLHRARVRIETDGWCRDAVYDDSGAICPIRAIRLEAASRRQADDACHLLLASIRRRFTAETIPSWNAQQTSVAPVVLEFDRAAELAHHRGL